MDLDAQETLAGGAVRECWEETGYQFTPTEEPQFVIETFFLLHDPDRFCHSLIFAVRGTVAAQPDPNWRPDPDEIRVVRWIPLTSLANHAVFQPHGNVLRRLKLV